MNISRMFPSVLQGSFLHLKWFHVHSTVILIFKQTSHAREVSSPPVTVKELAAIHCFNTENWNFDEFCLHKYWQRNLRE